VKKKTSRKRQAPAGLSVAHGSVYEVVDCTSEETFYPLAIYLTLDDAIAACMVDSPEEIGCVDHDEWDDSVRIEIRERRVGPSGHGRSVWTFAWNYSYDADDEKIWSRRVSPNVKDQPRPSNNQHSL